MEYKPKKLNESIVLSLIFSYFSKEAYPIFRAFNFHSFKKYFARLGVIAFAFFFLKGLVWIAVFYFGFQFFK